MGTEADTVYLVPLLKSDYIHGALIINSWDGL